MGFINGLAFLRIMRAAGRDTGYGVLQEKEEKLVVTTMDELDELVIGRFVPFRNKLTGVFREKYPIIFSTAAAFMGRKEGKVGLQVTEGGRVAGEYTLHIKGVEIDRAERGLDSLIELPVVGAIRPYVAIERSGLEGLLDDEAAILAEPFAAVVRHLPEMTIKFLR